MTDVGDAERVDVGEVERLARELERLRPRLPDRVDAGPEDVERGLATLVLALVEFLRQVLESQAVRRLEAGSLSDDEVERLGLTFMRLAERMEELKRAFGVDDQDLSLGLRSDGGAGPTEARGP